MARKAPDTSYGINLTDPEYYGGSMPHVSQPREEMRNNGGVGGTHVDEKLGLPRNDPRRDLKVGTPEWEKAGSPRSTITGVPIDEPSGKILPNAPQITVAGTEPKIHRQTEFSRGEAGKSVPIPSSAKLPLGSSHDTYPDARKALQKEGKIPVGMDSMAREDAIAARQQQMYGTPNQVKETFTYGTNIPGDPLEKIEQAIVSGDEGRAYTTAEKMKLNPVKLAHDLDKKTNPNWVPKRTKK